MSLSESDVVNLGMMSRQQLGGMFSSWSLKEILAFIPDLQRAEASYAKAHPKMNNTALTVMGHRAYIIKCARKSYFAYMIPQVLRQKPTLKRAAVKFIVKESWEKYLKGISY